MDLGPVYNDAGREWNVDPRLIQAVQLQETGGIANPDQAVSPAGARGRMGLMPDTARGLGVTDPSDPVQSIYAGAKYLAEGLDKEGSPAKALLYYHGGPNWRDRYGPESAGYVPGVTKHYAQLAGTPAAPKDQPVASSKYDDFLKRTGAGEDAPAKADYSDFLKRTGAVDGGEDKAAAASPASAPVMLKQGSLLGDLGRLIPSLPSAPASTTTPAGGGMDAMPSESPGAAGPDMGGAPPAQRRVGDAVSGAWNTENPLMSPKLQGMIEDAGPVGRYITSPLLQAGGWALRGGAALGAGVGSLIGEGGEAISPGLGRDLNMLSQVAPLAHIGSGLPIAPEAAPEAVARPAFVSERLAPPAAPGATTLDRINQLIAHDTAEVSGKGPQTQANALVPAPVAEPVTLGTDGQPVARSVGAAASRDMSNPADITITPAQEQAYRSTAEGRKLLEPQQPGMADAHEYVPGVNPSEAEREQTVNAARELKALNVTAPEVSEESKAVAAANNDARQRYFENIAGSKVDIDNAKAARGAQAEKDLSAAWSNKVAADAQPVIVAANEIKSSPDGRRPVVRNAIDAVTKELFDANGDMITDPEQLYGVRKHLDDLLSKEAASDDPKMIRAASNLQALKGRLDSVIETAAPGFKDYLKNFSDASRPIDAMEVLGKHEPKLYDAQNRMQYSRVQNMMRQIVDSRAAPGLNPYKSIPDETMQRLWNLRDDLRRSASAQDLARAPGSDTVQTAWDTAKDIGKTAGTAAAHGAANLVAPGVGSLALSAAKNAFAPIVAARNARRQTARGMEMLHPRNPLIPLD